MNSSTLKIFKILRTIAENVPRAGKVQMAAAIVYKKQIVSVGINQMKSHTFQAKFSKNPEAIYLHAETSAIYNALKKITIEELSKSSLYIIRLKADGSLGCSMPCSGCRKCISAFNIKKVFYINEYEHIESFYT